MKKQLKTLVILVVVVALLAALYFVVRAIQARRQAEEEAAAAQDEVVYLYEPDTITELTVTNPSGTFSYAYNDFLSAWSYLDDESYTLDKDAMNKFANELMQAKIERTLEVTDTLSAYGLEDPDYVLQLKDEEGTACTLYFGKQSGDGENYYVMRNDEDVIYNVTTNVYTYLDNTVLDYVAYTEPDTTSMDAITSIELAYGGHTYTLVKGAETAETDGDDAQYVWTLETDVDGYAGQDTEIQACVDEIVELITQKGVRFTGCVDYNVDDLTRTSYGLDGSFVLKVNAQVAEGEDASDDGETTASWSMTIGNANLNYNDRGDVLNGWYPVQLEGDMAIVQWNYTNVNTLTALVEAVTGEPVGES